MSDERQTVLIVDDVSSNIQVLNQVLKGAYQILFATSGEKALELAVERQPDLILLDVMMPGMDGHEVCRRLKAEPLTEEIPVIFVTAMNDERDETEGLDLGAIDYITKPLSPPIVQARVRNHLELKRRGDLLKRISLTDGLTGIANRRRFDEALEREWRRCRRHQAPLSLVLMDIDHFKAYNDRYGHLAGDDTLCRVAEALAAAVGRPGDLAARYGGEEFVCLLPETDREGAALIARHLADAVRALDLPHEGNGAGRVTISLGVASRVPMEGEAPTTLVGAADQALYRAKEEGRDRVVTAD